ncbi:MAG: helix-turn-helix domain-containing protein [Verrucomicrobiota bacterium]
MQKTTERSCYTINQFGRRYQIGARKVRDLIRKGALAAVDIGIGSGRTQWRISPEAVYAFEHLVAVKPTTEAPCRRPADDGISPTVAALLADD